MSCAPHPGVGEASLPPATVPCAVLDRGAIPASQSRRVRDANRESRSLSCRPVLALALVMAWLVGAPEGGVPRLRLELIVAPELTGRCGGPRDLEARIAERLGTDPFGARPTEAELVLWVEVDHDPSGLRATVDLIGSASGESSGARALSSAACAELFDAIAVSVAVRLDPLGTALSEPAATTTTTTTTTATPLVAAAASDSAPDAWTLAAHLAPWGSLGATPELSLGLRAGVTLDHATLRLGVEGRYDLATEARVARQSGVEVALLAVHALGCILPRPWFGCAAVVAGAHRATGQGLEDAQAITTPYVGAGLRGGVDVPLGAGLSLRPEVEVQLALTRTTLRVSDAPAWVSSDVSAGLGVAIVYALGRSRDAGSNEEVR
jgi:hypothetical protein